MKLTIEAPRVAETLEHSIHHSAAVNIAVGRAVAFGLFAVACAILFAAVWAGEHHASSVREH